MPIRSLSAVALAVQLCCQFRAVSAADYEVHATSPWRSSRSSGSSLVDSSDGDDLPPPPFKAMTWNILADGLASDGFVVQRQDMKVDSNNAWDACVGPGKNPTTNSETEPNGCLTDCKTEANEDGKCPELKPAPKDKSASVAEFIQDQQLFKTLVIDPLQKHAEQGILKDEKSKPNKGDRCASIALLKMYGKGMQDYARTECNQDPDTVVHNLTKAGMEIVKGSCKEYSGKPDVSTHMQWLLRATKRFNHKWSIEESAQAAKKIIEWGSTAKAEEDGKPREEGRGAALVTKITQFTPDILALQELDHYRFFQDALEGSGNATTLPGDQGNTTKYTLEAGCASKAADTTNACWNSKTFARLAKFGSSAREHNPNKKPEENDNDGVALFWRSQRFEAQRIELMRFHDENPSFAAKDGGVLAVLLKDLMSKRTHERCVWAITTHLASGDTANEEQTRVTQVELLAEWVRKLTTLTSESCSKTSRLLMMDGNSNENFRNDEFSGEKNMWETLKSKWPELTNYRPARLDSSDCGTRERKDLPKKLTVSVDKIRGVETQQLTKLGGYQLDRIDYLAVDGNLLLVQDVATLPRYDRESESGKVQAYNDILPSAENPSDHYPVMASITWKKPRAWKESDTGSSAGSLADLQQGPSGTVSVRVSPTAMAAMA